MSQFRVGGGNTSFVFDGRPLAFAQILNDQGPQPVAQPEEVQPIDSRRPIEIAFPVAHRAGTLQVSLYETWGEDVWEQLPGFRGAEDIIDVFIRNINRGSVSCTKIITMPNGQRRGKVYMGAVVTNINDSENVQIQTMTLPKQITMMYTHAKQL